MSHPTISIDNQCGASGQPSPLTPYDITPQTPPLFAQYPVLQMQGEEMAGVPMGNNGGFAPGHPASGQHVVVTIPAGAGGSPMAIVQNSTPIYPQDKFAPNGTKDHGPAPPPTSYSPHPAGMHHPEHNIAVSSSKVGSLVNEFAETIEKPIQNRILNCIPGFDANERSRCENYDNWVEVWSGNDGSMISGNAFVAFRFLWGTLSMLLIMAFSITDTQWFDAGDPAPSSAQRQKYQDQFLVYLTNWDITVQLGFFVHATIVTFAAVQRYNTAGQRSPSPCPWWVKACWSTYSMLISVTLCVDMLYWVLLSNGQPSVISVFQHAVNYGVQIIDFIVAGHMVPIAHAFYIFVYACCYISWSLIYWGAKMSSWNGDMYIYTVLNWASRPVAAAILSAVVIPLAPIIFGTLSSTMSYFRMKFFRKERSAQ